MGKIRIEVVPWLTELFGQKGSKHLVLEEEIGQAATFRDMINTLLERYPSARESMFLDNGELQEHVSIIYNDEMLTSNEALRQGIKDGDTVVLLPSFVGG